MRSSTPHKPSWRLLARFAGATDGSVVTYVALALPVLVGAVGLSVDVGSWHVNQRTIQSATDSAAVSAALEIMRSGTQTAIADAAENDAAYNGFSTANGDTMTINNPPLSGIALGAGDSVEVIIQRDAPTFFSSLFLDGPVALSARAVARVELNDACVWALDPSARGAVKVAGGAQVTMSCGILVNSTDTESISQDGGACLTSTQIKTAGGYNGSCINPQPFTNTAPVNDPLAGLPAPVITGCDHTAKTKVNGGDVLTLTPGVYCGSIEVLSSGSVHFEPGVYVMDGAGLTFSAQSTITGNDVHFYLSENSGTADAINIQAGATVNLTAGTTGQLAGVLFYHDANSPTNVTHSLAGEGTMDLEGILYFPGQDVAFAGGSALSAAASLLIARTVTFVGHSELGDFTGTAVEANNMLISASIIE